MALLESDESKPSIAEILSRRSCHVYCPAFSQFGSGEEYSIWTKRGYSTPDEAVAYVAQDSLTAAQQLVEIALDTAESLSAFDERGRIVPELLQPLARANAWPLARRPLVAEIQTSGIY